MQARYLAHALVGSNVMNCLKVFVVHDARESCKTDIDVHMGCFKDSHGQILITYIYECEL